MAEYIDRDAAIRAVRHAWAKGLEPSQYIEEIPAADAAPVVHAHAEQFHLAIDGCDDYNDINRLYPKFICSKCHLVISDADHYCSHCGAKLDGGCKA